MEAVGQQTGRCVGTMPRRAFLSAGLTGLGGLTLADLFAARARAGNPIKPGSHGPSMIVVWLWGGPKRLDRVCL
ncbi:MAG: hypothetical protein U0835_14700 [Isosphaeraceae bacterium]